MRRSRRSGVRPQARNRSAVSLRRSSLPSTTATGCSRSGCRRAYSKYLLARLPAPITAMRSGRPSGTFWKFMDRSLCLRPFPVSGSLFSGALPSPVWNVVSIPAGDAVSPAGGRSSRSASRRGRLFPVLCLRVERLDADVAELDACAVSEQTDVPFLLKSPGWLRWSTV